MPVRIKTSLKYKCSGTLKEGIDIANEIIFHELKAKRVSSEMLAKALGISPETLMQVLRFELDEREQIRILLLINDLSE